jgi:hypothetical protein
VEGVSLRPKPELLAENPHMVPVVRKQRLFRRYGTAKLTLATDGLGSVDDGRQPSPVARPRRRATRARPSTANEYSRTQSSRSRATAIGFTIEAGAHSHTTSYGGRIDGVLLRAGSVLRGDAQFACTPFSFSAKSSKARSTERLKFSGEGTA